MGVQSLCVHSSLGENGSFTWCVCRGGYVFACMLKAVYETIDLCLYSLLKGAPKMILFKRTVLEDQLILVCLNPLSIPPHLLNMLSGIQSCIARAVPACIAQST